MKYERISSYFDYLRKEEDWEERDFSEEKIAEVFAKINIEQYETVPDIPTRMVDKLFGELFDGNKARKMNPNQEQDVLDVFEECSVNAQVDVAVMAKVLRYLLRKDTSPKTALIVVDVQNDFISGSLALKNSPAMQDGAEVVPVINGILSNHTFDAIVYTKDWHPADHCSFVTNVGKYPIDPSSEITADNAKVFDTVVYGGEKVVTQVMWPEHCVQDSEGAQLHPDLLVVDGSLIVHKGKTPTIDSYSVFWDNGRLSRTDLLLALLDRDITTLMIGGLAIDYCVAYSAYDGYNHGFLTYVIEDACRGITEGTIEEMKMKCKKMGIKFINSSDIAKILTGS